MITKKLKWDRDSMGWLSADTPIGELKIRENGRADFGAATWWEPRVMIGRHASSVEVAKEEAQEWFDRLAFSFFDKEHEGTRMNQTIRLSWDRTNWGWRAWTPFGYLKISNLGERYSWWFGEAGDGNVEKTFEQAKYAAEKWFSDTAKSCFVGGALR